MTDGPTDTALPRLCIVLLAAGSASRFGSPKMLAPIAGEPLVARSARAALQASPDLMVVTGAYAEAVAAALDGIDARLLHNRDWAEGMGQSIAAAFRQLLAPDEPFDAAIVCPADLPLIGAAQYQRLIDAHRQSPHSIIVSDLGEAQGPPCLFPRHCFEELSRLRGAEGARSVLRAHQSQIVRVAMPEAALDLDTEEDLRSLQQALQPR